MLFHHQSLCRIRSRQRTDSAERRVTNTPSPAGPRNAQSHTSERPLYHPDRLTRRPGLRFAIRLRRTTSITQARSPRNLLITTNALDCTPRPGRKLPRCHTRYSPKAGGSARSTGLLGEEAVVCFVQSGCGGRDEGGGDVHAAVGGQGEGDETGQGVSDGQKRSAHGMVRIMTVDEDEAGSSLRGWQDGVVRIGRSCG